MVPFSHLSMGDMRFQAWECVFRIVFKQTYACSACQVMARWFLAWAPDFDVLGFGFSHQFANLGGRIHHYSAPPTSNQEHPITSHNSKPFIHYVPRKSMKKYKNPWKSYDQLDKSMKMPWPIGCQKKNPSSSWVFFSADISIVDSGRAALQRRGATSSPTDAWMTNCRGTWISRVILLPIGSMVLVY